LPHAPQFAALLVVLVSHPFAKMPSQFAKPGLQEAIAHWLPMQAGVPFATEHTCPHAPQLLTLVDVLVSHPFALLPSQFPKPELHAAIVHTPPTQAALAFANEQTVPHVPQLFTSVCKFVHVPEHDVVPGAQPPMHVHVVGSNVCPPVHAVETHAPLQNAWPVPQYDTHAQVASRTCPAPQYATQSPVAPHSCVPGGHVHPLPKQT
jgi:hypothetical protein